LQVTERSSPSTSLRKRTPTSPKGVTLPKMMAACELINRVRIARGWSVLPAEEAEITATVWIEILDTANVPADAYGELFKRAISANAIKRSKGENPAEITPEYLLGFWIGSSGLRSEREGKLDDSQRVDCRQCSGTGWKQVEGDGQKGVVRCDHIG